MLQSAMHPIVMITQTGSRYADKPYFGLSRLLPDIPARTDARHVHRAYSLSPATYRCHHVETLHLLS